MTRRVAVGLMALGLLVAREARPLDAQVPSLPSAGAAPVAFSGELGSFGELYHRSGTPGYLPGASGRLYLDGTAVLFGSISLGVNLIASTENGTSVSYGGLPGRQSIDQLDLNPRWRWGSADLGTFSHSYSPLTYSGIQVRGAAFDIHPGPLHLGAFGGQAAGSVFGGAATGSYRRTIEGGRLGFGSQVLGVPSTFVELTVLRARDDPNSLPQVDTTLPPNAPVAGGTVPVNPYAVTPQENLVVAASGGLTLLRGLLAWRGELSGAVDTRDVRAPELDSAVAGVPRLLRGWITPRVGTHGDYAFTSDLQLRGLRLPGATTRAPRTLTATLGLRYVGPGYTSLGVAGLASDVRAVNAQASLRFPRWSADLQAGRQQDNLLGQKLTTTTRASLGATLSLRVSRAWSAALRGSILTMGNGSADTLQWMRYRTWSIGTGQSFAFAPGSRFESLSLDADYDRAGDANPLRAGTDFTAVTADARLAIRVGPAVRITPSLGYSRFRTDTLVPVTLATYGVSVAWRVWNGRLSTMASLSRSRYSLSNTWIATADAQLRVTTQDALMMTIRLNQYRDTAAPANWYDEQIIDVRWVRRF